MHALEYLQYLARQVCQFSQRSLLHESPDSRQRAQELWPHIACEGEQQLTGRQCDLLRDPLLDEGRNGVHQRGDEGLEEMLERRIVLLSPEGVEVQLTQPVGECPQCAQYLSMAGRRRGREYMYYHSTM